jgi:hypothetical protein
VNHFRSRYFEEGVPTTVKELEAIEKANPVTCDYCGEPGTKDKKPCFDVESVRRRDIATRSARATTGLSTRRAATPPSNRRYAWRGMRGRLRTPPASDLQATKTGLSVIGGPLFEAQQAKAKKKNPDDAAAKKRKADAVREALQAMTLAYNNGNK